MYNVCIIGAGPAGLFAAYELKKFGINDVCIIERGESIEKRTDVMCGVGGAGLFSDGKLHFTPVLSHKKLIGLYTTDEIKSLLNYVESIIDKFIPDLETFPKNENEIEKLRTICHRNNIELVVRRLKHVGSDKLPELIKKIVDATNVEIKTNTEVKDVSVNKNFTLFTDHGSFECKHLILAPGRYGSRWIQALSKKIGITYNYDKIEIGVRVEFPHEIMDEYSKVLYEPIFITKTKTFDDTVRTFCPCPRGYVSKEEYEDFICVNGHSNSGNESKNSNFALVTEVSLTEPVENTTEYAKSIARLATTIGGGKPIIQRVADLRMSRRSTWERIKKSYVTPSLKDVTPGDLSMAMPHRIIKNIIEGLETLNKVMPGINSGSTLLYGPEVKFRSSKIETDKLMETKIRNLFVAGDGSGLSGNIIGAAATGILAARGIMKKLE